MSDLFDRVKSGDIRAIARVLTQVENGDEETLESLDKLYPSLPHPARVGITGPPGAGKSTLVGALVARLRKDPATQVGVVAVDPTSPFSGGALLGDRLRMAQHALDPRVYVRSMATRGALGGLAAASEDACDVLALAGFNPVLVETVGVGQSEVDIARLADTTIVVLTPASGDSVQALKAGIMEIADIVVVNKADLEGAQRLADDVREALDLRPMPPAGEPFWRPPVLPCVATENRGVDELHDAWRQHREHLAKHKLLESARRRRLEARLRTEVMAVFDRALRGQGAMSLAWGSMLARVVAGDMSPRQAATVLASSLEKRGG